MTELTCYGINGLFHQIVKQSRVMSGRYAVLPKGGQDLNMNNILSGLDLPTTQFPAVFCLPPSSDLDKIGEWENFNFRLIFACTAEATGDNKIKYPDKNTNTSQAKTVQDWTDMKAVCLSFMQVLGRLHPKITREFRLSQSTTWRIVRFAGMQNPNLNGVMIMFSAGIFDKCEFEDIENFEITIPTDLPLTINN